MISFSYRCECQSSLDVEDSLGWVPINTVLVKVCRRVLAHSIHAIGHWRVVGSFPIGSPDSLTAKLIRPDAIAGDVLTCVSVFPLGRADVSSFGLITDKGQLTIDFRIVICIKEHALTNPGSSRALHDSAHRSIEHRRVKSSNLCAGSSDAKLSN